MPKKILLADDSITIQKVVELTFSDGDYEVTAVNNGLKAIAKLAEIHPDIVLSDIIMPEKNGYEVCEYVKSHPEFRHIPVILLTGTFEPFDPDRAEKAGCDAVVTKPFESQNLIHKVEDLIQSSRQAASAAMHQAATIRQEAIQAPAEVLPFDEPEAAPTSEPVAASFSTDSVAAFSGPAGPGWSEPAPTEPSWAPSSPFGTEATSSFSGDESAAPFGSDEPAPYAPELPSLASDPFGAVQTDSEGVEHDASIFEPAQNQQASTPMPQFEQAEPPAGETRAFPMMSFEEMRRMSEISAPPGGSDSSDSPFTAESTPADAGSPFGASTPAAPAESLFSVPEEDSGATRAFPSMSFEQLQQMAASPAPSSSSMDDRASTFETSRFDAVSITTPAEETPGDQAEERPTSDQTSFAPPPFDEPAPQTSTADAGMADEYSGATRAFPMMSFEDLNRAATTSEPAPPEVEEAAEQFPADSQDQEAPVDATSSHEWSPTAPPSLSSPLPSSSESIWSDEPASAPTHFPTGEIPFPEPEPEIPAAADSEEHSPFSEAPPVIAMPAPAETESEPVPSFAPPPAQAGTAVPAPDDSLTDQQIDRIARRVIEMMSEQMVRNIAWEIVPDLAEMIVKERIRQLENE